MKKTKIAIVGTGGVGGFIGGKLARRFEGSDEVEVYFISRGAALETIRRSGLTVDAQEGRFTARPLLATDRAEEIGEMDYILYCTKSYDVESGIRQIMPCIGAHTVLVPFLNGVDSVETMRRMLPGNEVWYGCVYIVAYIVEPGVIAERTNGYRYYFGLPEGSPERLERLEQILSQAAVNAQRREDIRRIVWDKFAYISTVATVTSYTDEDYGGVLGDPQRRGWLEELLSEFRAVAAAKGEPLSDHVAQMVIERMTAIPAETTSSMQRDFRAHHTTELESLTGYVVREGHRLCVPVPVYDLMYEGLRTRR